jgi:hypothetical protein
MKNVSFIKSKNLDGTESEHAIIDRGNGEYTSMLKSTYDELKKQADQPIGGNN